MVAPTRHRDGHKVEGTDPIFTNTHGDAVHAESISQLFDRHLARTDIRRISFHDLRHTHASLLVAAGNPIKVVSERLGHAHPGFTMATSQHLVPGMSATVAIDFANMIANTVSATNFGPPLDKGASDSPSLLIFLADNVAERDPASFVPVRRESYVEGGALEPGGRFSPSSFAGV